MAERTQGIRERLKKLFKIKPQSEPQSRSNSPMQSLVSLPPRFETPAPVPPPPVDQVDLVKSPTDPTPPVDPASSVTITPEEAEKLRDKYTHFRILVIGRANAGKTTLLKRVCNTKDDPVYEDINPTEKRGKHDVRRAFTFRSNPRFIFHDSRGFEAGSKEELEDVLSFMHEKAKSNEVMDQIHMIWFCFDPDVARPLLELEFKFFDKQRPGNVPVVAIFTKFDIVKTKVSDIWKDDEENLEVALATLKKNFEEPLRGYKYPPCAYVRFESIQEEDRSNHQEQVGELIKQTAASIDNLALKMLFVTVQQNNLELCIEYAVNKYVFKNTNMFELILSVASWFGHCHDEDRKIMMLILMMVMMLLLLLIMLISILICLENSFWHVQRGYLAQQGFQKALDLYSTMNINDHFTSYGKDNWFISQHYPSNDDLINFKNDIIGNLLSHSELV
ncbi:hypothetical protein BYT27DRAFT_7205238 [Phlegmacium glaucopus]|nr:hypothetical protein BYT27DRAFT_7205238 [Phlegmacium glaucopus]